MRLLVRSRSGNLMLVVLGGIYAVSALIVLAWFVVEMWQVVGTAERLMQFALVVAGACGIWFIVNALANLSVRPHHGHHHRRA